MDRLGPDTRFRMSEQETAALSGQRVYIDGYWEFTVEGQARVIAKGSMITICAPGQDVARWSGKNTGGDGLPVFPGDKVLVHKALIQFQTEEGPRRGVGALSGQKEYIDGYHEFTVDGQTSVIANGSMIMICAPGKNVAQWSGKSTGENGQPVYPGDKVDVYNVEIEFKTEIRFGMVEIDTSCNDSSPQGSS
ncbi:hypothetical protein ACHAQJ_001096 [Trichoderma viride]